VPEEYKNLKKLALPYNSPIGRITKNHLIRPLKNRFYWLRVKYLFQNKNGFFYIQPKAIHEPYVSMPARSIEFYLRVEECPYKQHMVRKDIYIHVHDLGNY
jgi:hypothetical protein